MEPEDRADILLVDDQPNNLVALEAVLSDLGQNLVRASSGQEALKKVLKHDFAIILLDVQMPGMNGFETAAMLRTRPSCKTTPIIFLTAQLTQDADQSVGYSLGAVDFLVKPFIPEILKSKVSVFVDLHKKSSEIKRQSEIIQMMEKRRNEEALKRVETEKQLIREELLRQETERALWEERSRQFQESDRLKSEFLANVSHEIRTPMNGVIGMAEILLHSELTEEQLDCAQVIKDSAQALLTIINDILDLSKIEAGKVELELLDFNLPKLVEDTVDLLKELAIEKQLHTEVVVDEAVPRYLQGDTGRLRQVLLNLIGNALKFTEQGEVKVKVELAPEQKSDGTVAVKISVIDTGIGLKKEALPKLFRPFSQADGSTTRRFGGTGLGLSICKRLVQLMGGEIGVESEPERGSTFWFILPFIKAEGNGHATLHSVPLELTRRLDLHGKKILVAEDNLVNQRVAQLQLRTLGLETVAVSSGKDAVREALTGNYALVLMDCQMPDMDGLEAAAHIRESEKDLGRHVPIIGLTAHAREQDLERCITAGMDDYLTKPASLDQLASALTRWLAVSKTPLEVHD